MAPQQTNRETNKRVVCDTHYALSVDGCYHVRDYEEDGGPRLGQGDLCVGEALPVVAHPRAARGVPLEAKSRLRQQGGQAQACATVVFLRKQHP